MIALAPDPEQLDVADVEARLNTFLDEYESSETKGVRYLLRRPRAAAAAFSLSARLPLLQVRTSDTAEGRSVRRELSRGQVRMRTPLHRVSAAIRIPIELADYTDGASKQTLRRKVRAAEKRGISWAEVADEAEKRALIELADEHERTNEREQYRAVRPSNADLLDYDLWLVARSADGDPLMLCVTPIDDGVAALRYFRTLRAGDDATLARYLMTQVLVGQLHARGAHHLVDTTLSMHLSHGLRHFQRMVGFRLMRLDVAPKHGRG